MAVLPPVPPRASVRDLLTDLLGHQVRVTQAAPQTLSSERPAYLAVYRRDDGAPAAACICDLPLAAATGAAIGMVSAEDARAEVGDSGKLGGDLEEFFREVVNVLAKLLNSPSTPHVVMTEVHAVPGEVPSDVAELVLNPRLRVDHHVAVEGYDGGVATILVG